MGIPQIQTCYVTFGMWYAASGILLKWIQREYIYIYIYSCNSVGLVVEVCFMVNVANRLRMVCDVSALGIPPRVHVAV